MRRLIILVVFLTVLAVVLGAWWQTIIVHASQETGTSDSASRAYDYWSGFGSVIPWSLGILTAVVGSLIVVYRHHKCTTCRRIGRHTTPDTAQKFCHHHWTREHVCEAKEKHRVKFPLHLAHNPDHHAECFPTDPRLVSDQ